jgi:hypothetical protein
MRRTDRSSAAITLDIVLDEGLAAACSEAASHENVAPPSILVDR